MIIIPSLKLIVVKNPKCASSSLEGFIRATTLKDDFKTSKDPELRSVFSEMGIFTRLGNASIEKGEIKPHLNLREIKNLVGSDTFNSYNKVTSIRNPYDQMVSLFWWYIKKNDLSLHRNLSSADLSEIKFHFKAFVKNKLMKKGSFRNTKKKFKSNVWFAQKNFVSLDSEKIDVDYLIPYENFENKLKEFMFSELGFSTFNSNIKLKSTERPIRMPYQNYYDDRTKEIIENMFSWELNYLEYKF